MNFLIITATFLLSLPVFSSETIEHKILIPMPSTHQGYYGPLENELNDLDKKMFEIAVKKCGTIENINYIANINVNLKLELLEFKFSRNRLEGLYPLSSLSADLGCKVN